MGKKPKWTIWPTIILKIQWQFHRCQVHDGKSPRRHRGGTFLSLGFFVYTQVPKEYWSPTWTWICLPICQPLPLSTCVKLNHVMLPRNTGWNPTAIKALSPLGSWMDIAPDRKRHSHPAQVLREMNGSPDDSLLDIVSCAARQASRGQGTLPTQCL